jgi:transcriptional regulator with XRE-family HTH domain
MIGLYTSPLFNSILPARIGYIIQQRRKLLGLTQAQLAGRTHFSKYMISKIEQGKHDIKITELERLSFGLETTIKVIIVEI